MARLLAPPTRQALLVQPVLAHLVQLEPAQPVQVVHRQLLPAPRKELLPQVCPQVWLASPRLEDLDATAKSTTNAQLDHPAPRVSMDGMDLKANLVLMVSPVWMLLMSPQKARILKGALTAQLDLKDLPDQLDAQDHADTQELRDRAVCPEETDSLDILASPDLQDPPVHLDSSATREKRGEMQSTLLVDQGRKDNAVDKEDQGLPVILGNQLPLVPLAHQDQQEDQVPRDHSELKDLRVKRVQLEGPEKTQNIAPAPLAMVRQEVMEEPELEEPQDLEALPLTASIRRWIVCQLAAIVLFIAECKTCCKIV